MANEAQWRLWAADLLSADDVPPYRPTADFLPPLKRRRLNFLAKLMCETVWDLAQRFPAAPLVFASHDGEINRSFELWLELFKTETVSPLSFGLSVHNALPAQWSILSADEREQTALAVGADGLETALAECYAMLAEGAEQVLLVMADEPLSADYDVAAERAPFAYVVSLVLKRGEGFTLECSAGGGEVDAPYWGALEWLRFMLSDAAEHRRAYRGRSWLWRKNHE